jgi:hypothetical protein
MKRTLVIVCLMVMFFPNPAETQTPELAPGSSSEKTVVTKPRLVLVEIDHWKIPFFDLPSEVPVLILGGEPSRTSIRQYDFTEGMEAMTLFLNLKPKDPKAPAYRRFLIKWPLYQSFFKAIDNDDDEKASDLLKQIQTLDPQEPAVYFYQGSLLTKQGKYALAEIAYQGCIKRYPAYLSAYINLARLMKMRAADQEAAQVLRDALAQPARSDQADARQVAEKMLQSLTIPK